MCFDLSSVALEVITSLTDSSECHLRCQRNSECSMFTTVKRVNSVWCELYPAVDSDLWAKSVRDVKGCNTHISRYVAAGLQDKDSAHILISSRFQENLVNFNVLSLHNNLQWYTATRSGRVPASVRRRGGSRTRRRAGGSASGTPRAPPPPSTGSLASAASPDAAEFSSRPAHLDSSTLKVMR